ncbi:MAG: biotin--[acetyl-CoA-carboxylase] ligase [Thermosynechococcaceae cyanobacterium]
MQDSDSAMTFRYDIFRTAQTAQWMGHPLYVFETLTSTSSQLWQQLGEGAQPGTAVLALQQEAGRGQWGRTWCSPLGGLYLSVAIAPNIAADESAQLTVCSALGIAKALREQQIPVGLKWPNDLLLHGKKLGGILTETTIQQGRIDRAVIGIGINWRNPVPAEGIALQGDNREPNPPALSSLEKLTALILQGVEIGYEQWQKTGIEGILPDYLGLLRAVNSDQAIAPLSRTLTLQFDTPVDASADLLPQNGQCSP